MKLRVLSSIVLVLISAAPALAQDQDPPFIFMSRRYDTATAHARAHFLGAAERRLEMLGRLSEPTVIPQLAKNATLSEVLEYLSDCHDVTFIIDSKAFAQAGAAGIETLIVDMQPLLDLSEPNARTVLEAVLAQLPAKAGTTRITRRDYIEITTDKEWQATLRRRFARIGEQIIDIVTKCESLDQLGAMRWWLLDDLLGNRLDD